VAGALALLVLLVVAVAAYLLQDERLSRLLSKELGAALGAPVALRLERKGVDHWVLRQLAVGDSTDGASFVELEQLGLHLRSARLWDRRLCLDSLVIAGLSLNLRWEDSLLLPDWLPVSDSTAVEDTASTDPMALLRLLADKGWGVDSSRLVLRKVRLRVRGHQGARALHLNSPPLDMELRTPALAPRDLHAIARGEVPAALLASLAGSWSGAWGDAGGAGGLRPLPLPPALLASLAESGLRLEQGQDLRQQMDMGLTLERDTLRLQAGAGLCPADIAATYGSRALPLPQELSSAFHMELPLRTPALGAKGGMDLSLRAAGLRSSARASFRVDQVKEGWRSHARWRQELVVDAAPLAPLLRVLDAPLVEGDVRLNLEAEGRMLLDSSLSHGKGAWEEVLRVKSRRLALPGEGVELEGLDLTQRLEAEVDLADPLPRNPRLSLRGTLDRAGLALAPLEDPRRLDFRLELSGGGPRDSLRVAADLTVAQWQDGRMDMSVVGALPALAQWAEDYQAWLDHPERLQALPLVMDLESSRLSLDGLDPTISGGVRASAHVECGKGLRFLLELVPDALVVEVAGERLAAPLHRLEVEGGARLGPLSAPIPWPDTLWAQCRPDPLPPVQLRMKGLGDQARVELDWARLSVPRLLALLPPSFQPEGITVGAGTASVAAQVLLGTDAMPVEGRVRLDLAGGTVAVPGYGTEGLDMGVVMTLDTLGTDWSVEARVATLRQEEPLWSWEGLGLSGAGRVDLPLHLVMNDSLWLDPGRGGALAGGGDLRFELASLDLAGKASLRLNDWRAYMPDLLTLEMAMGGKRQLRPWPGLRLAGSVALDQRLERREDGLFHTQGRLGCRLDSLSWQQSARVEDLVLDLPFSQHFALEPEFSLPTDARLQPVAWNGLRARERRQPAFGPGYARRDEAGEGQGWPLRMGRARYDAWSVEELVADLRIGQGRLDLPEFRCALFGGGARGAVQVVGLDSTAYALDCSLIGLDSRYFQFGDRLGGGAGSHGLVNAVLHLEGAGTDMGALEGLQGQLRMPDLDRQVTLNLLGALDAQGVDPSIGKVKRLLSLPGFRYRVERVDFDLAHGFARPKVALRKSPFSPLPDVDMPMSPLPLAFMVRNFAISTEETP